MRKSEPDQGHPSPAPQKWS